MATDQTGQKAKDTIAEGMSEAGKHPAGGPSTGGKPGGTGVSQPSKGATDEVASGMSESGKDQAADQAERQPS